MDSPLNRTLDVAKALANPARIRILAALEGGECCVCQLTAILELAPSTVSAHLSELRRAGFLLDRKDGKIVFYRLSERPELKPWLSDVRGDPGRRQDCGRPDLPRPGQGGRHRDLLLSRPALEAPPRVPSRSEAADWAKDELTIEHWNGPPHGRHIRPSGPRWS